MWLVAKTTNLSWGDCFQLSVIVRMLRYLDHFEAGLLAANDLYSKFCKIISTDLSPVGTGSSTRVKTGKNNDWSENNGGELLQCHLQR
jgi:hypothetical protein